MTAATGRLLSAAVFASLAATALAADGGPAAEPSAWQPYFRAQADRYELRPDDPAGKTLKRLDEPVLRWTQPVRGGDDAAVYLWLDGDRPAAITAMLAWPHPDGGHVVQHEWHSLSDAPLTATSGGRLVWKPTAAGAEWSPVPDAGPVADTAADTAAGRLLQMKRVGRRFSGYSIDLGDGEKRWDLRLLPQPLYKYDAEAGPRAGGLFALVQGTDPEVLILIETEPTAAGGRWRYALARFCDRPLRVSIDDTEVWSKPKAVLDDSLSPFFVLAVEQRRPPAKGEAP